MQFSRKQYLKELISRKHNGMIKIISGLRRSGKSYLLFNLFKEHLLNSGVTENQIISIALDDYENRNFLNPDVLYQYVKERIDNSNMHYLLLDEIQLVSNFESVLNGLLRRSNIDIYVTGSNSRFLVSDVITEFRGRGDEIRIYPLSISELHEAYPQKSWDELWSEYSNFGGLPQAVLINDINQKRKYLNQLFEATYFRDIIDRYKIQHIEQFGQLVDFVASSIGSLTNSHKLSNTFVSKGIKLSDDTVSKYLGYMQDAFMISQAKRYDIRGRQYIGSPYKYYFTDVGLRNARLNFRQYEETHLMENVIYNELLRRGCEVDVGVIEIVERNTEGKQEHKRIEVDFVANRGSERYYIQSAFTMPDEEKLKQEERPLLKIYDSFRKIIIVQSNILSWYNVNGTLIMSLQDFLTNENSLTMR